MNDGKVASLLAPIAKRHIWAGGSQRHQAARIFTAILKRLWWLTAGAEMIEPRPAARRWTVMEDNQLHEMLSAGLTADEIGRRLARTPVAVYSRVQVLDKKRRKRPTS
jgi:hypothetical protein